MPVFQDMKFTSGTGLNTIYAKKCIPDSQPRAIIQIAHGIVEKIDRYDDFMMYLSQQGFLVGGNDHLGHGKSVQKSEERGFFALKNGWNYVVEDMVRLHDRISAEYPGIPYIMFGHSMGSFLTRTYMIDHPDKYDYAILSGTGHQGAALVNAGLAAASLLCKIKGVKSDGKMLNDVAFGSYLDKIENPRTAYDWLSRDVAKVDEYIADPDCGYICTASVYRDMMSGIKYITNAANIKRMAKEKPVYFMSGAEDPVGEYGKGVERAYKAFCKAGLHDVTIRLYPEGRHEMLNETNRADVYADILKWINEKLA